MIKNEDLRTKKTKRAIHNSFLKIMGDVGFSHLSVKKVIEDAEINRSTFYLHYKDKYDLLDTIEDNLLGNLKEISLSAPVIDLDTNNIENLYTIDYTKQAIRYIYKNKKLFALLISDKGDPQFSKKIIDLIGFIWEEKKVIDRLTVPTDYLFAAVTGMISNMITIWVKNDFKESPQEFTDILVRIVKGIPKNIFS